MTPAKKLFLLVIVVLVVGTLLADSEFSPLPEPESPFPATGIYMLVVSESADGHAWEQAKAYGSLRDWCEENAVARLFTDKDRDEASDAPHWRDAIAWANRNATELPWVVARCKRRVYEGPLPGGDAEELAAGAIAILEKLKG